MSTIFSGTIPALMTPCKADRTPDFDALVRKGKELIALGMDDATDEDILWFDLQPTDVMSSP